jgi:hypothetical protein
LQKLECRGIDFDPIEHQIPCFLHIINIYVKHIINDYHKANFSLVPKQWVSGDHTIIKAEYLEARLGKLSAELGTLCAQFMHQTSDVFLSGTL